MKKDHWVLYPMVFFFTKNKKERLCALAINLVILNWGRKNWGYRVWNPPRA